jgi:predicted ABC-type ATPase
MTPTLYILAGPNGAGKTTASIRLLPQVFKTDIFINADLIAAALNPQNPEAAAIAAGRIMLQQIDQRLAALQTFAIETTLSSKGYLNLVRKAQLLGYEVVLFFFYLPSAAMAMQRVALRVSKGGHHIPNEVVERRYEAGLKMLFEYAAVVNEWFIYDNETQPARLIAEGSRDFQRKIHNFDIWKLLKNK